MTLTPKEKAEKLVYDLYNKVNDRETLNSMYKSKQCALISVENEYNSKIEAYNEMAEFCPDVASQAIFYAEKEREQVKQEIEKL